MKDDQLQLDIEVPDKLFFRIGEVAELVGVESHVLRYWESEFRMRPQRSNTGQRMYQRKDIARFLRIRKLLHDEGFTIAGARKALLEPGDVDRPLTEAGPIQEAVVRLSDLRRRIGKARERFAQSSPIGPTATPPAGRNAGD